MSFIAALWQPILLSAVLAFVVSALAWTVLPHHKKEFAGLAGQDGVIDAIRKANPGPGLYMFPWADDPKERMSPEMKKRIAEGPAGIITVFPRRELGMGKMLVQQFVFFLVTSVFVAYIAVHTLHRGDTYLTVYRVAGTAAILAYVFGTVPESIWFGKPWKTFWLSTIDGVLYGLVTAGSFGALWPKS